MAGSLIADPDVPWYGCGTVAQTTRADEWTYRCAHLAPADGLDNLELPDQGDLDALRSLIDAVTIATEWPGDAAVDLDLDR